MRSVSVVLLLAVVAMASAAPYDSYKPIYDLNNASAYFKDFVNTYNRIYKDEPDREAHYRAFVASLKQINELNEKDSSASYGINKFADYTEEEKKNMFGLNTEN